MRGEEKSEVKERLGWAVISRHAGPGRDARSEDKGMLSTGTPSSSFPP